MKWLDLTVGSFVRLNRGEPIPADVILFCVFQVMMDLFGRTPRSSTTKTPETRVCTEGDDVDAGTRDAFQWTSRSSCCAGRSCGRRLDVRGHGVHGHKDETHAPRSDTHKDHGLRDASQRLDVPIRFSGVHSIGYGDERTCGFP